MVKPAPRLIGAVAFALAAACPARVPEDRVARRADPPRAAVTTTAATPSPADASGAAMIDPDLDRRVAALDDEHPEEFAPAIEWLVANPGRARPALRAIVAARRDDLGTARALLALGRIGDVDDIAVLAAALRDAPSASLRWDAAKALRSHPRPEAAAALIDAAQSPSAEVTGAAATMLGERKVEAARPSIEALLDHADAGTRYRAVHALGALGAAGSATALTRRAKVETDVDVKAALRALGYR